MLPANGEIASFSCTNLFVLGLKMRVLVTGGNGTVGSGLCDELRSRGHDVVSCDRNHRHDEIGFSLRTDVTTPLYARCDVGEFRQIERIFDQMGPFDYDAGMSRISMSPCGERMQSAPKTLSVSRRNFDSV